MACYGPATGYDDDAGRFDRDAATDVTTDDAAGDASPADAATETDASAQNDAGNGADGG